MPKTNDILADVAPTVEKSGGVQKLANFHNQEWGLFAHDFWYYATKIITDDEETGRLRSYPLNESYLRDFHHTIETNQKIVMLKPRRMMISWQAVLRMQWKAVMCGSGLSETFDSYRGGIASVGETEACYMIERISKTWHRLPEWVKRRNQLAVDNQMFLRWEKGGTIQAFPMKKEGPQSFGFTDFLFDEMAIQDAARSTWTGLIPTLGASGKLLAVSTPNGKANFYGEVWLNKEGVYNDVTRIEIDWWDHSDHDKEWFRKVTAGMNRQMIARMFEKSFSVYAGKLVFPEYNDATHLRTLDVLEGSPMFIGHDFGFLSPCNVYFQVNTKDQFLFHRCFFKTSLGYDVFLKESLRYGNSFYKRRAGEIHFIDPAGRNRYASRAQSGAINDIAEIKIQYGRWNQKGQEKADPEVQIRFGALEIGTRSNEGPRLKEFRKLFGLRADDQPGAFWDPRCVEVVEALKGGYVFPERKRDDQPEIEQPSKNDASHPMDASQYGVTGFNRMGIIPDKSEPRKKRVKIFGRAGF